MYTILEFSHSCAVRLEKDGHSVYFAVLEGSSILISTDYIVTILPESSDF